MDEHGHPRTPGKDRTKGSAPSDLASDPQRRKNYALSGMMPTLLQPDNITGPTSVVSSSSSSDVIIICTGLMPKLGAVFLIMPFTNSVHIAFPAMCLSQCHIPNLVRYVN